MKRVLWQTVLFAFCHFDAVKTQIIMSSIRRGAERGLESRGGDSAIRIINGLVRLPMSDSVSGSFYDSIDATNLKNQKLACERF